jgi:hypothetical protein
MYIYMYIIGSAASCRKRECRTGLHGGTLSDAALQLEGVRRDP